MLKESVASRYSEALFALAKERGDLQATVAQLDAFVAVLRKDPELAGFYASPVVDRAVKEQILRVTLADRLGELVLNFVVLLVLKRRENLVEIVARQMHELQDRDAGRESATIATPKALAPVELSGLAQRLSKVYGRTIIPHPKVAPELLGGIVVQAGDRYVDASVAGKLEELRRHLLAGGESWGAASPNGKPS